VKILYRRIQAAAHQVCEIGGGDAREMTEERACINQAVDGAVHQVDLAALTDMSKGGQIRLASK
jgi:UrcA family protein